MLHPKAYYSKVVFMVVRDRLTPQRKVHDIMSRLSRVAIAFALASGAITLGAQPVSASVGCWGDYCSGKSPISTNCIAGAYVIASTSISNREVPGLPVGGGYAGEIELMWSPTRKTNWARLNLAKTSEIFKIAAIQDTGYTQTTSIPHNVFDITYPGIYHSPMIYSPHRSVRAEATGGFVVTPRFASTKWG